MDFSVNFDLTLSIPFFVVLPVRTDVWTDNIIILDQRVILDKTTKCTAQIQ